MNTRSGLLALALVAGLLGDEAGGRASGELTVRTIPPDFIFHFRPRVEVLGRPSLGLVLSGGGARGVAHIGVLQRLDEGGYPIDSIVGTSSGALTGALYACGFSGKEIEALFQRLDFSRAFLDPLMRTPGKTLEEQEAENGTLLGVEIKRGLPSFAQGLKSGREVQRTLEGLLARGAYFSEGDFDHLKMPLRVLATNLETGQGRRFAQGDMVEVLRAALALPGAFKPVLIENQQYVDGALVENIPVFQSREAFHPQVLVAVDVSSRLEKRYATNFFSVASRSLDLVIEQRQRESAAAATLVIRPEMKEVGFIEYGAQLPELVQAGIDGLRAKEPELRRMLLEHVANDEVLPTRTVEIRNPVPVDPGLPRVIKMMLPEGQPIHRSNVLAVVQQAIVRGWLKDLKAEVVPREGPEGRILRLEYVPFPAVQTVDVEAPPAMRDGILRDLQREFPLGERYNPERFGVFLGRWVHTFIMAGMPLVDVRGSGFDEASGRLRVVVQEPLLTALAIKDAAPQEQGYLQDLMAPLLGQPVRTAMLRQRLDLSEERLRLAELRYLLRPKEGGVELVLTPQHDKPHSLDLGLGWETTLGGQWGLRYRTLNLGLPGWELVVEAARNRLQQGASLGLSGPFQRFPGAGLELKATIFEQRLGVPLRFPAVEAPAQSLDMRIRSTDVSLGGFARFGDLGQGRVSLMSSYRKAEFLQRSEASEHRERSAQLGVEWDNFDRHTFPRKGLLLRGFYTLGETLPGLEPQGNFRMAYVRARGLASLGQVSPNRHQGLELDLEWGYGDRLPLDRWWTMGGSSFLVGSRSLQFLSPNFLVGRFGLPLRMNGPYGLSLQIIPRFDYGVISAESRDLFRGMRSQGMGMVLRTMAATFYVELSYGFLKRYEPGQGWSPATGTFNALIGTQPFDLWKRR